MASYSDMTHENSIWKQAYIGGNAVGLNSVTEDNEDVFIRSLCIEFIGSRTHEDRVLVFGNYYDASVEISFIRPARANATDICLGLLDDARINLLGEQGLTTLFDLLKPTHVVFCRYWGAQYDFIRQLAQAHRAAMLGTLDDNLLEVPIETGPSTYAYFQDETRRAAIRATLRDVDLFVPSTPHLATAMRPYRSGPVADWPLFCSVNAQELPVPLPRRSTPTIGYMASASHAADLDALIPALKILLEKRPTLSIEFFGTIKPPAELEMFEGRIITYEKADTYSDFIHRLKKMGWWVGLAPLAPSAFNKTKTNTKWIEYTLAGIATLVTSTDVYGAPVEHNACRLASADNFLPVLEEMLDSADLREDLLIASRTLLKNAYSLSSHYEQLKATLKRATILAAARMEAAA